MDWGLLAEEQQKAVMRTMWLNNMQATYLPIPLIDRLPPQPVERPALKNQDTVMGNEANDGDKDEIAPGDASLVQKILRCKLVDNQQDMVEIQHENPNSPLYSVKSFEELELSKDLLKGVYAMGYNFPSKIQETTLPVLLVDPPQNIIAQSQSGTGKTAAFVLTCLSRINPSLKYPQVLILSPTFELAEQTGNVARIMAKFCPEIEFCFAVRGQIRYGQIKEQFLIGTPGKVLDWALRYKCFDLKKISVFVLDEADVMISTQGHQDQSIRIHRNLNQKECQMLLFSATYSEEIVEFAQLIVPDPIEIRLRREEESLDNIKQYFINVARKTSSADGSYKEQKYNVLQDIYGLITIGQAIIFCFTRKTATWLAEKMISEGHAVALLTGELTVEQRIAVIRRFRDGEDRVLITTNVCARGIDIPQVTVVFNFDLPINVTGQADCETYLHRIGRSGRFGHPGFAFNMVDSPRSLQVLKDIQAHFGKPIHEALVEDIDETTFA